MYITLETGGSRPPTTAEASQIRAALGCAAASDLALLTTRYNYAFADTPVTIDYEGGVIFVDCTLGNVLIYLPAITAAMQTFVIRRIDTASANTLTIQPAVADAPGVQIEGGSGVVVPEGAGLTVRSNTTHWWLTSLSGGDIINLA